MGWVEKKQCQVEDGRKSDVWELSHPPRKVNYLCVLQEMKGERNFIDPRARVRVITL